MLACRSAGSATVARQRPTSILLHHVEEVYAESSRRAQHRYIHSSASSTRTLQEHAEGRQYLSTTSGSLAKFRQPKPGRKQQRALQHALQVAESLKKASLNDGEPSDHATVNDAFTRPSSSSDPAGSADKTPEEQIAEILRDQPSEADLVPTPIRRSSRGEGESSYRKRYKTAFDRLNTSFNVSQIKSMGGSRNSRGNKAMHIQMIMDRAGWPVPQAPTKAQETEAQLSSRSE